MVNNKLTKNKLKYAVDVKNVHKYFGDLKALNGVSLSVEKGKIYGLLGPNGAGKTTLIRIMTTLSKPNKGEVFIGGIDALKYADGVRPLIGLAGQSAAVDEFLTGRENLRMIGLLYHLPMAVVRKRAESILEQLDLTDAADRQVKTYSGGMRRRLDLGASLVGNPEILFLDEPTTGLDPRTRIELWNIIRDLSKSGTTIMLTTQYLEEADELADKIGVIDHGKMIAEGTSDQLKTKIGGDVVEFSLSDASRSDIALKIVEDLAVKPPVYDKATATISVPVANGAEDLFEIVKKLDAAGFRPTRLSLHRPSLDEVFLTLTGQKFTGNNKKAKPASGKRRFKKGKK